MPNIYIGPEQAEQKMRCYMRATIQEVNPDRQFMLMIKTLLLSRKIRKAGIQTSMIVIHKKR